MIAANVKFFTHDGGVSTLNSLGLFGNTKMDKMGRIKVGNNVYIGTSAMILPGVTIGDNCVIGAGSIVTKDIPDNSCAVGVPAKVKCSIDEYFERAKTKVYPTIGMEKNRKRQYLIENVK